MNETTVLIPLLTVMLGVAGFLGSMVISTRTLQVSQATAEHTRLQAASKDAYEALHGTVDLLTSLVAELRAQAAKAQDENRECLAAQQILREELRVARVEQQTLRDELHLAERREMDLRLRVDELERQGMRPS